MRIAKIKSRASLLRAAQHNTRERMPPNADPAKTQDNFVWGGTTAEALRRYSDKLPAKVRKNAVHAVEVFMSASHEFSGNWTKFLNDCNKWAASVFGGNANLLHVAYHSDETTPHVHMLFMPLKDGALNCKHYLGGGPEQLRRLQDDFFEKAGRQHGLERGLPKRKTGARHKTLKQFYAEMDALDKAIQPPKRGLLEKDEAYAERYKAQVAPLVKDALDTAQAKKKLARWEQELTAEKQKQNKNFNEFLRIERKEHKNELAEKDKEIALGKTAQENLRRWRTLTPEQLEELASEIRQKKCSSYADLQTKQERTHTRGR
jgi:hypothetical protein